MELLQTVITHLADLDKAAAPIEAWRVIGGLLLLSPIVAIGLVILNEAERDEPHSIRQTRRQKGRAR